MNSLIYSFVAVLLIMCAAFAVDFPSSATAAPLPKEPLIVATEHGKYRFLVEVARTEAQLAKGLMFRQNIPSDTGMLFAFDSEHRASMWMKDTLVPLDMLFIDSEGIITDIAPYAEPHSLRPITASRPVVAVLEVAGGTSHYYGIRTGDAILHSLFGRAP